VRARGIGAESPQDLHGQIRGLGAESPVFCGAAAKDAPKDSRLSAFRLFDFVVKILIFKRKIGGNLKFDL
jgi:hypothetical protein